MSNGKSLSTCGSLESGVNQRDDSESRPSPPINTSKTLKSSSTASATATFELKTTSLVKLYAQKFPVSISPRSRRRYSLQRTFQANQTLILRLWQKMSQERERRRI